MGAGIKPLPPKSVGAAAVAGVGGVGEKAAPFAHDAEEELRSGMQAGRPSFPVALARAACAAFCGVFCFALRLLLRGSAASLLLLLLPLLLLLLRSRSSGARGPLLVFSRCWTWT